MLFTCCYLVAQPPTSTVDHHTHLSLTLNAHLFGGKLIVDLVHHLYLSIMVAGSQSSQLKSRSQTHENCINYRAFFSQSFFSQRLWDFIIICFKVHVIYWENDSHFSIGNLDVMNLFQFLKCKECCYHHNNSDDKYMKQVWPFRNKWRFDFPHWPGVAPFSWPGCWLSRGRPVTSSRTPHNAPCPPPMHTLTHKTQDCIKNLCIYAYPDIHQAIYVNDLLTITDMGILVWN